MKIALIVGAGVVVLGVGVAVFVLLPYLVRRVTAPKLEERIARVYKPEDIVLRDLLANSLGQESRGVMQIRGNGALVLTKDSLHFFQIIPERDLRIPLSSIAGVTTVRSHLGKTVGFALLHVAFAGDGGPDSMAWYVRDLPAWLAKLEPFVRRDSSPSSSPAP